MILTESNVLSLADRLRAGPPRKTQDVSHVMDHSGDV
jgi:hypothetical protein